MSEVSSGGDAKQGARWFDSVGNAKGVPVSNRDSFHYSGILEKRRLAGAAMQASSLGLLLTRAGSLFYVCRKRRQDSVFFHQGGQFWWRGIEHGLKGGKVIDFSD